MGIQLLMLGSGSEVNALTNHKPGCTVDPSSSGTRYQWYASWVALTAQIGGRSSLPL